jgi:predicted methyltransferase
MNTIRVLLICAVATFALPACKRAETPATSAQSDQTIEQAATGIADVAAIDAALANPNRFPGDREQDDTRKSKELLVFLGARPGMHVIDYFSAGGFNAELLSLVVGADGRVIAYNNEPYAKFSGSKPQERFGNDRLPNVEQIVAPPEALSLPDESLDAALFVLSYHDLYWRSKDGSWPQTDPATALARLVPALKQGAVVVVVDHVANPGGDPGEIVDTLHRIDPDIIKRDFQAAGLTFESEANFLRNPQDDRTKQVFDESIRGKTDRVVMRFVKK